MFLSPIFFIGLAILIIFGIKAFISFLVIYILYLKLIGPFILKVNKKKLKFVIPDWIESIFKKDFEDAKIHDPKNNNLSFNLFKMTAFTPKRIIMAIIGIFVLFILIDGFVMVPAGNVAVILDRGRGVLEKSMSTGLHLKIPFWQIATKMDIRLQSYTMSGIKTEGDYNGDDAIESLTKDGQKVKIDVTIQYYINQENASKIYKDVGLDYVGKIIRPSSRSVIRNAATAFTSKELFQQDAREKAQEMMYKGMLAKLKGKNITLDDVLLRNVQFSDIYLQAIEEKQVAEQKIQKAEFEKQEAEIQKEKRIIEAQAESESIKLKGQVLKDNPSVVQFEMVQKIAPNIQWGILPEGVLPMLNMKDFQNINK